MQRFPIFFAFCSYKNAFRSKVFRPFPYLLRLILKKNRPFVRMFFAFCKKKTPFRSNFFRPSHVKFACAETKFTRTCIEKFANLTRSLRELASKNSRTSIEKFANYAAFSYLFRLLFVQKTPSRSNVFRLLLVQKTPFVQKFFALFPIFYSLKKIALSFACFSPFAKKTPFRSNFFALRTFFV